MTIVAKDPLLPWFVPLVGLGCIAWACLDVPWWERGTAIGVALGIGWLLARLHRLSKEGGLDASLSHDRDIE